MAWEKENWISCRAAADKSGSFVSDLSYQNWLRLHLVIFSFFLAFKKNHFCYCLLTVHEENTYGLWLELILRSSPSITYSLEKERKKEEDYIYLQVPSAWGMYRLGMVFTATMVETMSCDVYFRMKIVIFSPFLKVTKIWGWCVF